MAELMFGRDEECRLIKQYLNSNHSEFVAVYGRRRVGKTFLLRQTLGDDICFYFTGMDNVTMTEQLQNFSITLRRYYPAAKASENWLEAFDQLRDYVESSKQEQKVIFIDELPWLDTLRSGFIPAFEHFWNSWASARSDIKLFVCGSATSWMLDNIINNHGGLYNRTTHQMYLEPFSLGKCKEYFDAYHFGYSQKEVADFYMIFGGIPYYMSLMNREQSVVQNVDRLIFSPRGELRQEKDILFRSLFRHSEDYVAIIDALSEKKKGLTRAEILDATGLTNNTLFGKRLLELEKCEFMRKYTDYSNRQRNVLYQLTDPLCHFWNSVVSKNQQQDSAFWSHIQNTPLFNTWSGLAFEILCLNHVPQIKQALGISGIQSSVYSWRSPKDASQKVQIDLLIDRADRCVNLCEMKYSRTEYELTSKENDIIQRRIDTFQRYAEPRKSIRMTMLTSFGVKRNSNSYIVQNEVTLADLFK